MSEIKIQGDCYLWFTNKHGTKLNNPRYVMFAVPNEAIQNMAFAQIAQFKAGGLRAGVSDTIVLLEGKVLFIEFKTKTGTQSKAQEAFQAQVEALGFKYYICRSLEQFKDIINEAEKTRL